ncbi:hypothetical protein QJS04_geneDACA023900 [Acorus gramineus]|uniref:Uncharacterized protein n=1 Tax=Acorus gramineus TaxID=55184 RepID=A0AAV9A3T6_ACOGR|nr:hypothetical protein QJS04_geneDACA023900 [Acorus gramineus]
MGGGVLQCFILSIFLLFSSGSLAKKSSRVDSRSHHSHERQLIQNNLRTSEAMPRFDVITPITTVPVVNPANPTMTPVVNPYGNPNYPNNPTTNPTMTPVVNPYGNPNYPTNPTTNPTMNPYSPRRWSLQPLLRGRAGASQANQPHRPHCRLHLTMPAVMVALTALPSNREGVATTPTQFVTMRLTHSIVITRRIRFPQAAISEELLLSRMLIQVLHHVSILQQAQVHRF